MGIYIPGIETPKGHNYVTLTIWPSGAASYVLFDREGILRDFKDFKEIKVVPVPPHGRLIDADALLKGEGRYLVTLQKEAICVDEICRASTIIPADPAEEGET